MLVARSHLRWSSRRRAHSRKRPPESDASAPESLQNTRPKRARRFFPPVLSLSDSSSKCISRSSQRPRGSAIHHRSAPLRSTTAPLRSTTAPLRSGPASLYDERRLLDDVTRLRLVDDATSASTHTVSLSLSDARRDRARRTLRHGRTALCRSGGSTDSHPTRFRSHGRSMAPAAATVPAVHRPLRAASAAAPLLRRPPRHDASLSSTIDDLSSTLYHPRLYFANVFLYPCSPKIFLKLFFLIIFACAMKVED